MSEYHVDFLVSAEKDMLKIATYISNELYNYDSAMRLIDRLEEAKNSLKTLPYRHPIYESDTVKTEFRKMIVDNYIMFYIIKDKNVYIAFVIHHKQDFDAILKNFKSEY